VHIAASLHHFLQQFRLLQHPFALLAVVMRDIFTNRKQVKWWESMWYMLMQTPLNLINTAAAAQRTKKKLLTANHDLL
jgi:hypothetical protein